MKLCHFRYSEPSEVDFVAFCSSNGNIYKYEQNLQSRPERDNSYENGRVSNVEPFKLKTAAIALDLAFSN